MWETVISLISAFPPVSCGLLAGSSRGEAKDPVEASTQVHIICCKGNWLPEGTFLAQSPSVQPRWAVNPWSLETNLQPRSSLVLPCTVLLYSGPAQPCPHQGLPCRINRSSRVFYTDLGSQEHAVQEYGLAAKCWSLWCSAMAQGVWWARMRGAQWSALGSVILHRKLPGNGEEGTFIAKPELEAIWCLHGIWISVLLCSPSTHCNNQC